MRVSGAAVVGHYHVMSVWPAPTKIEQQNKISKLSSTSGSAPEEGRARGQEKIKEKMEIPPKNGEMEN